MCPSIKKFKIKGLFDKKDVELSFENNAQIFVGENGLGKTTILNSLYYVLSCDFDKLSKIDFEKIEIHFKIDVVKFSKIELLGFLEVMSSNRMHHLDNYLQSRLTGEDIAEILKNHEENKHQVDNKLSVIKMLKKKGINQDFPYSYIIRSLQRINEISSQTKFNIIKNIISKNITSKILYFPTYRRIEEELQNLGDYKKIHRRTGNGVIHNNEFCFEDDEASDNINESLIQFGMSDVEERINSITQEISKSSIQGFSKLTGDMLIQLLSGRSDLSEIEQIDINIENIKIILDRVGNNLSTTYKDKIITLIKSKEIYQQENMHLVYFLKSLLGLYESQSRYDTAIKKFKDVCNSYLNEKHYEYNESAVDLRIYNNGEDKREVLLSQLSSGEKQIVSLFSKIYLG